jgi:tricorn protease
MKRLLLLSLLLFISASSFAQQTMFASRPTLTPDGSEIYFSHGGDIYKVSSSGGLALKVISMGGNESHPKISPDGKYLAFSSNVQGNNNVYIVPVAGGEIKQLTFHDASDVPASWRGDSKVIYFESNRYNTISTYGLSVDFSSSSYSGTPVRIFSHYFNTIANLVQNPVTGEFYFNESAESFRFATRKGYRGDHNPDIKSWNPVSGEYKELTSYRGKDIWPMTDSQGRLYYVSDEQNGEANIVRYEDKKYLTSFNESVQYPSICFDGSKIVFIKGYRVNILDTESGRVTVPDIDIANNTVVSNISLPLGRAQGFSVSPDGKKLAFSFRGLLFVSDVKGNFVRQMPVPQNERVDEVLWGSDSKNIYYTRTNGGWTGIYSVKADSPAERAIYTPESSVKSLTPSAKREKIAFIDGGKSLMLLDTGSEKVDKLASHEFWAFQNYRICFSFDDKFLTYTAVNLFERDVFIYDFANKRAVNITNSANFENDPVFSPDGRYLYLLSNRMNSAFPRGANTQLYRVALDRYPAPFESDEFEKLFGAKGAKRDSSVALSPDNLHRRYESVVKRGEQNTPFIISNGGRSFLLFNSNHEGEWGFYVQEIKEWDMKPAQRVKGSGAVTGYSIGGKELFVTDRESLFRVDAVAATAVKVEPKFTFEKSIKDEFSQMFYEVWASLEQNFYDQNFHGVDWRAKRDYYASFLPFVVSRDDLRTLINDMLNELNSSHMGFTTFGREEEGTTRYFTAATGLMFSDKSPYILDRIVAGSRADFNANPLRSGDELISVNGVNVDRSVNREFYFAFAALPKELTLRFSRGGNQFDVNLHTFAGSELRSLLYAEWEDHNRSVVTSATDGQVAYIHMRDMSPESLERFVIELNTDAVHKSGLILDLRFNNGGNVHKEVIDLLGQREHFRWSHRDNPKISHPNVVPGSKPLVVLINERSLSDAEVTSNGIKTLSMAKLIGTETYRWIIFTSGARLVDGSSVRLPAWGCYTLDGKDMEFEGVSPDIYIRNTFKDRLNSIDPQLERAIEEILKDLLPLQAN